MAGVGERGRAEERSLPPFAWPLAAVVLAALVVVASWWKVDLANNDFERFDDLRLSFAFFGLFVGLAGVYVGVYLERRRFSPLAIGATAVLLALLFIGSFPVGSRDVFGYAFFGRMLRFYGADPFLVSPATFDGDAWLAYTTRLMTRPVTSYGPVFLAQTWLIDAMAAQSMWASVWLHKLFAAVLLLATVALVRPLLAETAGAAALALLPLLAWNPLALFEAAGAAHNDIAMTFAVIAALRLRQAEKPAAALVCLAVAFWYKWYSAIFLAPFLIDEARARGMVSAMRQGVAVGLAALVAGWLLFLPFPGAIARVLATVIQPEKVQGIFPTELSPPLALLFWAMRGAGLFDTDAGFRLFDLTRLGFFAAAIAWAWWRQWRAGAGLANLIESCFLTGLAFFFLLITQLWPWHLLVVIALGIARGEEPFVLIAVLLTLAGLLSYALTFLWATVMMAAIVGSLAALRRLRPAVA